MNTKTAPRQPKISRMLIESLMTERGGYTRDTLSLLGIKWPPRYGWKHRLIGKQVPMDRYAQLLRRARRHCRPSLLTPDEATDQADSEPTTQNVGVRCPHCHCKIKLQLRLT